jgi:cytidine deaminase
LYICGNKAFFLILNSKMIKTLTLSTVVRIYDGAEELPTDEQDLLARAKAACSSAYAPYSNFHVGAAILLEDGTIITGSNQENVAYPSGLCAERTAIYYTGANYAGKIIKKIAVAAYKPSLALFMPANPCGACRQAMVEYENKQNEKIKIILVGNENQIYVADSIESLLPLQFKAKSLGATQS